jgi:uncharacterized membrane protein YkoI
VPPSVPIAANIPMSVPFTHRLMPAAKLAPMRALPRALTALMLAMPLLSAAEDRRVPATGPRVEHDHDQARQAVERGDRVALSSLIADALKRHPGKLIEAELEDDEYEIEILREDGVVVELEYDARTGELLETEVEDD